ncbi:golgin candidate 5-like [Durio zibethinus]|uniref:Golgin candidate 5-like n=1 Tax=Durio zibethinus TaxID=66656 RepID=A0A6P5XIJ3_DURZI|nr:golgin candidate 5-like [Durio zibethinus]XP_022727732.1 golgin candidate 5-like [Durio zibethinus]
MGFNKVYQCLMGIFPQVDSRILKAVAIENSKDVDAAAEIVLSEIMPYLSKQAVAASSSSQNQSPREQPNEAVDEEENNQLRRRRAFLGKRACSSTGSLLEPNEVVRDACLTGAASNVDSFEAPNIATTSKFHENNSNEAADIETEELILLGNPENISEIGKDKSSVSLNALGIENSLLYADPEIKESGSLSKDQAIDIKDGFVRTPHVSPITSADDSTSLLVNTGSSGSSNDYLKFDGPVGVNVDFCRNISLNGTMVGEENAVTLLFPSTSQEQMPEGLRAGPCSESGSIIHSTDSEKQERGSLELKSQQDSSSEMGDNEDDTFNSVVSRSSQTCRIDLLEEIIEDAKNNKKTLFQAMQSIMNLMREVELQEEAAEQAKEEAARGGFDILIKVEELKQMLPLAKEANDMHAGEVYGEKAILATEVRELQSRLLSLSEERDKSLAILDEMRQTLEVRQAAAEELLKTAEQEKWEKEEHARNALAEQEAIRVKVVEESKILQQEAEQNGKLREFLMERGLIVDSLQGEISVICEDVRLLKEKFDERVPLSKSISSSQTSCILASSGSSLKSMASDLGPEQGEKAITLEKRSLTPSVDKQSPKIRSSEERYKADGKELLDDGWEFFDRDADL